MKLSSQAPFSRGLFFHCVRLRHANSLTDVRELVVNVHHSRRAALNAVENLVIDSDKLSTLRLQLRLHDVSTRISKRPMGILFCTTLNFRF